MKKMYIPISIIHFILTFLTDHFIFDIPNINIINYIFCKIITLITLFYFWKLIQNIINKDQKIKIYLKNFLIYVIPMLIILIMIWPGIWLGDDNMNLFNYAKKIEFFYNLNYLTSIFYIISYMLIPIPSGVTIMQLILFGIILSFITTKIQKKLKKKKIAYLLYIPFFLPHTIFYTFYANRPIIVGILYLLLTFILLFDYKNQVKISKAKYTFLIILGAILTIWRKEQIYLLIFIPILLFTTYHIKLTKNNIAKVILPFFSLTILFYFPQYLHFQNELDNFKRNLPTYITPISYMLNTDLKGKEIDKKIKILDKVININICKQFPSFSDAAPLYHKPQRKFTYKDCKNFKKAYTYIIINNPDKFLYSKMQTFKEATSIKGDVFSSINLYTSNDDTLYNTNNKFSKTILNYKSRMQILKIIEGKTNNNFYNQFWIIFNNLYIPLVSILTFFIISIIKRRKQLFLISGMYLGQALIIFLTAPASYFMYYFYLFLLGWFLLIVSIILKIELFQNKKYRKLT